MCSTISLLREPSLATLPKGWSNYWRKDASRFFARILANRWRIVVGNLIGPEQNCAVMGRSIKNNLRLIREIIEGIKDSTDTALSLDQSKAFDRVDHQFSQRFRRPPNSNRSSANGLIFVSQPSGGDKGEWKVFMVFCDLAVGPLLPLLNALAFEPLL